MARASATRKKGGAASTALARVGDPLITATGQKIDPDGYTNGRKHPKATEPITFEATSFRAKKRRTLKELPGEVNLINGVGAIFIYTLLGVGDREIADALKITAFEVAQVRESSAYKECFDIVVSELISSSSESLQARIASYSHSALNTVAAIAMDGKKEETKLRAADSLLDRAGVRAKDNELRNKANTASELRITVIDASKETQLNINIDVNPEGDDNGYRD